MDVVEAKRRSPRRRREDRRPSERKDPGLQRRREQSERARHLRASRARRVASVWSDGSDGSATPPLASPHASPTAPPTAPPTAEVWPGYVVLEAPRDAAPPLGLRQRFRRWWYGESQV